MARSFHTPINLNGCDLQNAVIHPLAAAPGSPTAGQLYFDTVTNELNYYDGTDWVPVTQDTVDGGAYVGTHDASGGLFPTPPANTKAGDKWLISVGGTLPNGDVAEPGDLLFALVDDPDPLNNAHWQLIEGNANLPSTGVATCERQTANLVADTPLTITAANMASVESIQVFDSAGNQIEVCVEDGAGADEKILTSCTALSNVSVRMLGC